MKILLSFTHPEVVPNLYEFVLLLNTEDILKNVGKQTVDGSYWLLYGINCLVTYILQNNCKVSKWWQNFWVNYAMVLNWFGLNQKWNRG